MLPVTSGNTVLALHACCTKEEGFRANSCRNVDKHPLPGVTERRSTPCSIVQGYFYYIFGFCFVVGTLTVLITVEVAIVCTYVQLCAEDYLWWYSPPRMPLLFPYPAHFTVYIRDHCI